MPRSATNFTTIPTASGGNTETTGCPCHGSLFDAEGRVLKGSAKEPLTQLEVRSTGGLVRAGFESAT